MPTYDYRCRDCGHQFELYQQITAPVKRKCPECKTLSLERLIGTGAGIIFRGGGFYQTDYRSDSYRKAADAEKTAAEPKKEEKPKEAKSSSAAGESSPSSGTKKEPAPKQKKAPKDQ